jgi:hypothetical protein
MLKFAEWFELNEGVMRPGAKQGLYPPGYGGIGLYPPQDWMPGAADAITYMPKEDLNFKFLYTFLPPKKMKGAMVRGPVTGGRA